MKALIKTLLIVTISTGLNVNATTVNTESQAIALCKDEAMKVNDDYKRSKSRRIKKTRAGFSIKLKVFLSDSSVTSSCEIKRDGTLVYSQE